MDTYSDLQDEWSRFGADLSALQQRLWQFREALRTLAAAVPVWELTTES